MASIPLRHVLLGMLLPIFFALGVENDKYPFEACATGCYPLRRYRYWESLLVNSVSLTPRMMIHLHTKHKDGFRTLMHCGVKNQCLDVIHGDKVS